MLAVFFGNLIICSWSNIIQFCREIAEWKPIVIPINCVCVCRKVLSLCNLRAHHWKVPVWVVCDGSDPQQSILLSTFCDRKSGCVTRSTVKLLGHWSYKQAEEYAVNVRKEHLSMSRIPGCEVWKFILLWGEWPTANNVT